MNRQPYVFGIRHLSPGGAWHLKAYLDQIQPELVLIEGLSDGVDLVEDLLRPGTKPPVAILAYTDTLPVRTAVYPIASYSPEYQALLWAKNNKAQVRLIDLPSSVLLALPNIDDQLEEVETLVDIDELYPEVYPEEVQFSYVSLYDRFALAAGEPDYETYWERNFEHNLQSDAYRLASYTFGQELRNTEADSQRRLAENLIREAYMRREIQRALADGYLPEKTVIIVGAYHAPVMDLGFPPMTDEELAKLPTISSRLTLMPYSYFKLSSKSGYGAGNHAPAYYEMMWRCFVSGDHARLSAEYLSSIVQHIRAFGTSRSAAEVIEGVRLANALAALKNSLAPTLRDLKDAAVALIGQGEPSVVAEAMAKVEIGTAIGQLPEGVSQTSIQDDFNRELKHLKLEKYKTAVKQTITLDLRENRRVRSHEAAFVDLHRSFFFNRLVVLGVGFAEKQVTRQDSATWAEHWALQWTPEVEIALVEAVLMGETIEIAAAYQFENRLHNCQSVEEAALIVRQTCECGMPDAIQMAQQTLKYIAGEAYEFNAIAKAAAELGFLARYGDVRQFNPKPLNPIIEQLFTQGALALLNAAHCDNAAAKNTLNGISELNKISLEYDTLVNETLWIERLQQLADADHLNPLLSGYACAILLERNLISSDNLTREVSRRLSPGIEADLGAGWFEGLSKRNRYALLTRLPLWEQLASYISTLEEEQFTRALVFLRRAFGGFSVTEKRHIAENLGEVWGFAPDNINEIISAPLSQDEEQTLGELDDFNFDDL